jgi:glycosyltransferase involved in cell wall biosynthesis
MLDRVRVQFLPAAPARNNESIPWPQGYMHALERGQRVFDATVAMTDWRPDLIVGHGGLIPTFLLREMFDCPIIDYCEYYFAQSHRDLTYRLDLPPTEPAPFFPRCINAATLVNLVESDAGYAPTRWQQQSFPQRFWPKIEVHNDGIDTELYRPRAVPRLLSGQIVPSGTRIVTFAARGLESVRGFDLFMKIAQRILRERSDVLFAVAGDESVYYGWDRLFTGQQSFKQWAFAQGNYDLSRFIFLGHVTPPQLADIFCLSDLHIYLSVPFVLSWSLLDAMACGSVILAADTPPVQEVVTSGRNGLLAPLFDTDQLASLALQVLADPGAFRPLGQAARSLMEENYSLDVAIPALNEFFQRKASRQ